LIEGGWICRACWKSNRPGDDRCYRCKTPRGEEQLRVQAGSLKEKTEPGYALRGRLDTRLGVFAALVAWPMWLSGWIGIIASVLVFLLALLGVVSGQEERALLTGAFAAVGLVFSWLWIFISRSVRRHARWAYAIAAIVYLVSSAPWLLGMVDVPRDALAQLPAWYSTVQTTFSIVYLLLGICAVFLLIASFMREGSGETATSNEAC
jgi:hypothetical protein